MAAQQKEHPHVAPETVGQLTNERGAEKTPEGAAIILANHRSPKGDLASPKHDLNLMESLLCSKLGFLTATRSLDHTDEKWRMQEMVSQIKLLKLDEYRSFVFYYSGHADAEGIVLPDGNSVGYQEIIDSVCECESLEEKPKLLIFDCSRAVVGEARTREEVTRGTVYAPPDCLVVFATSHGFKACGDKEKGSVFTYDLAQAVNYHLDGNRTVEFPELVAKVCGDVHKRVLRLSDGKFIQKPEMINSLKKPIMLSHLEYASSL